MPTSYSDVWISVVANGFQSKAKPSLPLPALALRIVTDPLQSSSQIMVASPTQQTRRRIWNSVQPVQCRAIQHFYEVSVGYSLRGYTEAKQ